MIIVRRAHRMTLGVAVAAALAVAPVIVPAGAQALRPPLECGRQTRLVNGSTRDAGAMPVLLVHGFQGSPNDFSKSVDDKGPTLTRTLPGLPGIALYTFDYSAASKRWVTNGSIGPALADAIVCLRQETGRRVVVIAHSMGGLATRFAQGQVLDGRPVAQSIAQVITIGTPNRGVILLSIANGDISNVLVRAATEAADAACDDPPKDEPQSDLCELLRAADIPAVKAMDPDSKRLAALPPWDENLVIDGVAADMRLRLSVLGLGTTVSLGDIVVTVESATADANPKRRRFVATCRTELTDLIDVVDQSHCSHANEVSNPQIVRHVVSQIQAVQQLT